MRQFDAAFCKELVYHDRCGMFQCSRKPKKDDYCIQHHPDSVAKRKAKSDARWEKEKAGMDARDRVYELEREMSKLAETFVENGSTGSFQVLRDAVEELKEARKAVVG
ncbi:unnamed protein product [marine sediment metagenome]|uniref:Uncharacterized protein n=1 Tax=marine sediment metagenome TaxID=412755 RepID=X0V1M6_9ZZZZ